MIRALARKDFDKAIEIHRKYYKEEFEFPGFLDKFLCAFVVEDEDSKEIVAIGGLRTITESILITDKDFSPRIRKIALQEILAASMFFTEKFEYKEIHAFIQDSEWEHHLRKIGFKDTVGKSLVLGL